ncbi:MAG: hypothetical protein JWM21_3154 [Acidobacteria bacterium]|nr:hypothetical protein [Acidobacteriota bacterium]
MKNRIKIMSGALTLTFMLLFSAAAFANSTNRSMAKPAMNSAGMPSGIGERHHRHHRRHWRNRYLRR